MLFDKRFSLKFRILNILSGDYLRSYLVSVLYNIKKCDEIINYNNIPEQTRIKLTQKYITRANKAMEDVWYI